MKNSYIEKNNNSDRILIDLVTNQKKNINVDKKLAYNDLKRISKYLSSSIFDDQCSLWNGYITVIKNDEKNSYINFYFNGRKYALHRILYINYIGDLADSEYIKFRCPNKGKCCNINHFYKINKDIIENKEPIIIEEVPEQKTNTINSIIVDFNL